MSMTKWREALWDKFHAATPTRLPHIRFFLCRESGKSLFQQHGGHPSTASAFPFIVTANIHCLYHVYEHAFSIWLVCTPEGRESFSRGFVYPGFTSMSRVPG
ncbi:MAG: hypothetical protein LBF93_07920 [Zoogloeaceae bacterium]|jgi:hypothetical protein|nr:hypothetical protein [Zoogloeaceae bacterium]